MNSSESIEEYIRRFEMAELELKNVGANVDEILLAIQLLDRSTLTASERQMVNNKVNIEQKGCYEKMKISIRDLKGILMKKTEETNDSFYTNSYRNDRHRGRSRSRNRENSDRYRTPSQGDSWRDRTFSHGKDWRGRSEDRHRSGDTPIQDRTFSHRHRSGERHRCGERYKPGDRHRSKSREHENNYFVKTETPIKVNKPPAVDRENRINIFLLRYC